MSAGLLFKVEQEESKTSGGSVCFHQEAGADTPLLPVGGSVCDMTNEAKEANKGGLQLTVTPVFFRSASRNCQAITSVHSPNCLKFGLTWLLIISQFMVINHFDTLLTIVTFLFCDIPKCTLW